MEGEFSKVPVRLLPTPRLTSVSRAASAQSNWCATITTTTRKPFLLLMDRNGETTRLPPGYTLDLVGDPCVIVLRRADGTVGARFTKHADPEEIRRAAEEDHGGGAGGRERDP